MAGKGQGDPASLDLRCVVAAASLCVPLRYAYRVASPQQGLLPPFMSFNSAVCAAILRAEHVVCVVISVARGEGGGMW